MGRWVRFVGRRTRDEEAVLPDGTVVARDEAVEVLPAVARELLHASGANDDSRAEWVPAPRPQED